MKYKEKCGMVPEVFISSTFYDLKYVRENLGVFVESYGFTPIISETGNIGYIPFQTLDKSCYEAMRASDMAILIVGGRYGSHASDEDKFDKFFDAYKSVTVKEFETAVNNKVPVYVFIEAPVYFEYQTYKKNMDKIEDRSLKMNFASIDNINIFRFISAIYSIKGIPVWPFSKIDEITTILKKQWASLFLNFLISTKNDAMLERIENPISEMESSIKKISILLDAIGNKVVDFSSEEGAAIKIDLSIEKAANEIANSFAFFSALRTEEEINDFIKNFVIKLYQAKDNRILMNNFFDSNLGAEKLDEHFRYDHVELMYYKGPLESEVLESVESHKDKLAQRLMQTDCLIKMKLVKS